MKKFILPLLALAFMAFAAFSGWCVIDIKVVEKKFFKALKT